MANERGLPAERRRHAAHHREAPVAQVGEVVRQADHGAAREAGLVNLAELFSKGKGVVERISETDHDLDHLVKEGHNPAFVPGLEVTVLAKSPNNGPVLIQTGGMIYDICNDVASVVWVKKVVE